MFAFRSLALVAFGAMSTLLAQAQYTLPLLPYPYDALEPAISKEIMTLHYDRHHRTYVNILNNATAQLVPAIQANDLKRELELQSSLRFNGGGHINHSLFWLNLTPVSNSTYPTAGPLASAVKQQFGTLEHLKSTMTANALAVQGSGWTWLAYNSVNSSAPLQVLSTGNQDPLLEPLMPLLGIDVWEHAYYLDYKNERASYLEAIWTVINWNTVEQRLIAARQQKA